MAARVVADVRAYGGVRLLVTVDHRLTDGAVAAQVARERFVVIVVHSMTGHVMLQRRAERAAVTAEQLILAEMHTQVLPELDLHTTHVRLLKIAVNSLSIRISMQSADFALEYKKLISLDYIFDYTTFIVTS